MKPNYRRCVSCRKISSKKDFWRIVRVYPSHQVQLDRGMGRSAYLCPQATCLKVAEKKNRLGKALRAAVPKELYQILWERITAISPLRSSPRSLPRTVYPLRSSPPLNPNPREIPYPIAEK